DKLVPAPEKLLGSFIPHAPDSEIDGRIMTSYGGVAEISRNSIVTLNRGNEDGLEEGHVLAVYSHGEKIVNKKKQVDPRDHIPEVNLDIQKGEGGKRIVNLAKDDEDAKFLKLPDERIGLVMVFRTFDHVAYALVMQSERPIHLNDAVRTP
ncbi:MAG TPA: peptidoglycan-binding protein LysM, partial [Novimethylophilus sp.]